MKTLLFMLTLAAGLCGAFVWLPDACGQNGAPAERARHVNASRIAYIDLGEVFKQYKKNTALAQEYRQVVSADSTQLEKMLGQGRELEKSLRDGTLDRESPEFFELEKKVRRAEANVNTFKAVKQRELKQQEIKVLLEVYRDVSEAVRQFAEQNGYSLVLKIDRDFEAAKDYKTIQQTLSQVVVRHSARDDITEAVINYLNKQYETTAGDIGTTTASPERGRRDRPSGDDSSAAGAPVAKPSPRTAPNSPSRTAPAR